MADFVDYRADLVVPIISLIRKYELSMSAAEAVLDIVKEQLAKVPLSPE